MGGIAHPSATTDNTDNQFLKLTLRLANLYILFSEPAPPVLSISRRRLS